MIQNKINHSSLGSLGKLFNFIDDQFDGFTNCWCSKALSKQEGPIFCCDAWFLHVFFFEFASAACCKKDVQKSSITTNVCLFLFCQSFSEYLYGSSHIFVFWFLVSSYQKTKITVVKFFYIYFLLRKKNWSFNQKKNLS